MLDPKDSAERICDLLFFRGLLEILKIMMQSYSIWLKTEDNKIEIVNNLIEMFDYNIQFPEKLFSLKFKKKFKEKTRNMIIQKVEKFLDDYIKGKIDVIIHYFWHLSKENEEN